MSMDKKYQKALDRVTEMGFTGDELLFIFSDWPNWDEHIQWLLTTTKEDIENWIEHSEFGEGE